MGRILIVDDEPNMRRILASNLRLDQHQIWEAGGVDEAQRSLASNDFDVVITDQKMPDGEGLSVLASAHENDSTLPVIILTAVATIELAVEMFRAIPDAALCVVPHGGHGPIFGASAEPVRMWAMTHLSDGDGQGQISG